MSRPPTGNPTQLELAILNILWTRQPASVREVRDALAADKENPRDLALTSVTTMMNIMVRKGHIQRDKPKTGGVYTYTTRIAREDTASRLLSSVINTLFKGSASAAVLNLVRSSDIDKDELKDLRKLINDKLKESE